MKGVNQIDLGRVRRTKKRRRRRRRRRKMMRKMMKRRKETPNLGNHVPLRASDIHQSSNLRKITMTRMRPTRPHMPNPHACARANHIPPVELLAARIPAPRPQYGVLFPVPRSPLVYPAPLPAPMDRCTARITSSFRAGAA
jgi:hypothetical protein